MKLFLSYRFTGEDPKELEAALTKVKSALEAAGHSVYCSFWDESMFREKNHSNNDILTHSFKIIDGSDGLLAFVKSSEKSEGMLIEVGYALARGKRLILAVQKDVKTVFAREMAHQVVEFTDVDDLAAKLRVL